MIKIVPITYFVLRSSLITQKSKSPPTCSALYGVTINALHVKKTKKEITNNIGSIFFVFMNLDIVYTSIARLPINPNNINTGKKIPPLEMLVVGKKTSQTRCSSIFANSVVEDKSFPGNSVPKISTFTG